VEAHEVRDPAAAEAIAAAGQTARRVIENVGRVIRAPELLLERCLLALLCCVPVHGVFALLCSRDARFFDLVLLWCRTRLPAALGNLRLWKASSYSPLVIDVPSPHGLRRRRVFEVEVVRPIRQVSSC